MSGPSLFDSAAERAAIVSGRALSQERAELLHPIDTTAGAGFRCIRDHAMRTSKARGIFCPTCDGVK